MAIKRVSGLLDFLSSAHLLGAPTLPSMVAMGLIFQIQR